MKAWLASFLWCLFLLPAMAARESITLDLKVGQNARQALVFPAPAAAKDAKASIPLVFCFHGHGGNATQASRSFGMHEAWPEATVVYPQGLPTPGQLTDPEGKRNGWQGAPGLQEDRDLKFFDALLAELRKRYPMDAKRIFVMGHSNGGGFTYLLWATRGKEIAAVAPCAAVGSRVVTQLTPNPCLHLAAKNDPLVQYAWQEKMMAAVKRINGCEEKGTVWAPDALRYEAKDKTTGAPMIQYIHQQGHRYPDQATALMVKFFREISTP
jgi:polyhydroxybutyrate depolymerase